MIYVMQTATFAVEGKIMRFAPIGKAERMSHLILLQQRLFDGVYFFVSVLAALIADGAAGLASALAAGLTFAATDVAALLHAVYGDTVDMFHNNLRSFYSEYILIYVAR